MKKRGASFYILIVLALTAVGALVFLLAPGRQPSVPAVTLPTAQPDAAVPVATEHPAGAEIIAVTPETVQTVIGTLHRIDSYSRSLEILDFWSGGSRRRGISVWCRGESLRLRILDAGGDAREELLFRDGEKWIWYPDSDKVYHGAASADDPDAWQTLLTYEDLLAAPAADILDAGYTDFADIKCIYVRWRSGALGYVSECYVDPGTGLLMGERCYDGETLIYSMDSSAPDVTTPDESVFTLPRGVQ